MLHAVVSRWQQSGGAAPVEASWEMEQRSFGGGGFHSLPLRVKCPALYASETVPLTSQIYITVLLRRVAQFQPIPQQLVDSD